MGVGENIPYKIFFMFFHRDMIREGVNKKLDFLGGMSPLSYIIYIFGGRGVTPLIGDP